MTIQKFNLWSLISMILALSLAGCGGGGGADALNSVVSDVTVSSLDMTALSANELAVAVVPFVSSGTVAAPTAVDAQSPSATALQPAAQQTITPLGGVTAAAKTYTPAQIRTAYQLPSMPTSWSNLSATQAAQMGAGQTIYIVDAMHDPNVIAELAAFNQNFGLPTCTTTTISPSVSLPLLAALPVNGCQISVVYSNGSSISTTAPVYNSSWATEIALDVQWAHATAPLARIILIEAPDASVGSLLGAVNLANAMGPGIVSMSFGAAEGSWITTVDSAFSAANMTYVAATGDSGSGVGWPSVSSNVLAVGGTSLNSYTATSRSETVWASTGGGISQYIPIPNYQNSSVPGMGSQTHRNVADVSFNADPYTGQYVAVIPPGSTSVQWYSVGGTSLATPQWAGVVAVTNATRAQNGKGPLGLVQNFIYQAATTTTNFFTSIFDDIISGSNGFLARTYYDLPTGLGTPNTSNFIALAGGGSIQQQPGGTPPVVSPITINGVAGTPLSFSMAYTSPDPVTWSLSASPSGMIVGSTGVISWPTPAAGTYLVSVTALDTVTHLSSSAIATVVVVQPVAPVVNAATVTGQAGHSLSYQVNALSVNPVSYTLVGSTPAGLVISSSGVLSWANPVVGNFSVTVKATDSKTSASGTGVISVQIAASTTPAGPLITASPVSGSAGRALTGFIGITDQGARSISVSIKGAPSGMGFGVSGQGIVFYWNRPVKGTYTLVITATDNNRLSSQASMLITVN